MNRIKLAVSKIFLSNKYLQENVLIMYHKPNYTNVSSKMSHHGILSICSYEINMVKAWVGQAHTENARN